MTDFDHTDLDRDELLLEPGWVLLQDGFARRQAVLVRHRVYLGVGQSETVESLHPDLTRLRLEETLLVPGLVDAHHHLTQSFGKALVFGEPSEIFRRVWVPLEGQPGRGDRLSGHQARRAGIVAGRLHNRLRRGHPHGTGRRRGGRRRRAARESGASSA